MIKLFLSHASEDKPDFVRPLASELRKSFDVWYDEYELVLGDSLLGKITEGLSKCDFGVVVLSHKFFSKKWPQSELDGLFNLETNQRKVILPVWKDVSETEVCEFSPILAGRLGVSTESGIEKVVQEIKRAVGLTERVRNLEHDDWKQSFTAIEKDIQHKQNVDRLTNSTAGVQKVQENAHTIIQSAKERAEEIFTAAPSLNIRVEFNPVRPEVVKVHCQGKLALQMFFGNNYSNNSSYARIHIGLYRILDYWGSQFDIIEEFELSPDFDNHLNVKWKTHGQEFSNELAVLDFAFSRLSSTIKAYIQR